MTRLKRISDRNVHGALVALSGAAPACCGLALTTGTDWPLYGAAAASLTAAVLGLTRPQAFTLSTNGHTEPVIHLDRTSSMSPSSAEHLRNVKKLRQLNQDDRVRVPLI